MNYQIKKASELTENEIENVLKLWNIPIWNNMKINYFRSFFKNSEFHFIVDNLDMINAIVRLNFDFTLEISGQDYQFVEVVGLVSSERKKGNGKKLVQYLIENVSQRNLEAIGFCEAELRNFYEKCNVKILHDKAKIIKEKAGTDWVNSEDDDILIFNLSPKNIVLLNQLPEKTYLKEN